MVFLLKFRATIEKKSNKRKKKKIHNQDVKINKN